MSTETLRLGSLHDLGILDSPAEAEFDALVQAASLVCGTPISLISLVDETRQWFKANIGLPGVNETPRDQAFCAHAILGDDVMEVPDATADARFADNPLVTGAPDIRFYAGAPIRLRNGHAIGTLCVIDRQARRMDAKQLEILRCLACAAGYAIEDWRARRAQAEAATALRASEARLRRSEAFLNRIGQVSGVGGFEFDLLTGRGIASPEAYRIWGLPAAKILLLEAVLAYFAPEARPAIDAALAQAMAGGGGWDLELKFLPADGGQLWLRTVGTVEIEHGTAVRLIGTVQDVSDRVAERHRLQTALERLSLATESCEIGIWDWDIEAGSLRWDARMRALFGLPPGPDIISAATWRGYLHPEDRGRAEQDIGDAVAGRRAFKTEFRIMRPDGSVRDIAATGRLTRDAAGRPLHMVGTNWDITERRAVEALRAARDAADRALRAKSEFLATMSHEIRSPLSGLIGVLDLLRDNGLSDEQARMVGMAHRSAGTLLSVLNDILDFSKIEAGALTVAPTPVDVRGLIEDTTQPWHVAARHKHLGLIVTVDEGVPPWVRLDGLRLSQILNNLLANAVKFTIEGEVRLHVAASPHGMLAFAVADTGIGMSEAVVANLFTPFMQADASTTRRFGGTGLGLSISLNLAQLMGGALTAESRLGEGSVFRLAVPLAPCDPATDAAADQNGGMAATQTAAGRVLVVDDDPIIRWLSQQQIIKLGLRADAVHDGAAALARLQAEQYDLVLTDCHMPVMDGVGLTTALRAADDASLRALPIIGLTADVTDAQRDLCLAAGMSELAIKPLTVAVLRQLMHRHLGRRDAAAPTDAAPQLRPIAFDDQIFVSVFTPGDAEGAAWLSDFIESARSDVGALGDMLASDMLASAPRRDVALRAHRLAGAAFSVGAMLLGQAARDLELAVPSVPVDTLRKHYDILQPRLADAVAAMGYLLLTRT